MQSHVNTIARANSFPFEERVSDSRWYLSPRTYGPAIPMAVCNKAIDDIKVTGGVTFFFAYNFTGTYVELLSLLTRWLPTARIISRCLEERILDLRIVYQRDYLFLKNEKERSWCRYKDFARFGQRVLIKTNYYPEARCALRLSIASKNHRKSTVTA